MLKQKLIAYAIKQILINIQQIKEIYHERQKKNELAKIQKAVLKNSKQHTQIQPTESKDDDERRH